MVSGESVRPTSMSKFQSAGKSCPKGLIDSHSYHKQLKKLKYEARILEMENATFVPLVFACSGDADPCGTRVMTRITAKLSEKRGEPYANVMTYIRTKIRFALLKSAILCTRGSGSRKHVSITESSRGTIVEKGRLS